MKRKIAAVAVLGLCVVMIAACGIRDAAADKKISDGVANGTIVETVSENTEDTTFFGKVRSFLSGDTGSGTDSSSNKRTTAVGKYEDTDVITALMEKQQEKKKKDRSGQSSGTGDQVADETRTDQDQNENTDPDKPYDITHPDAIENGEVEFSDETILVKFGKKFDGKVNSELKAADIAALKPVFEMKDAAWYTAFLSKKADVTESLEKVRKVKGVITAEYNYKYETTATDFDDAVSDNPMTGAQQLLDTCGIKDSWKLLNEKSVAGGSSSVTVAVIDTGVDYEHEDLKANMWCNKKEIPDNGIDDDGDGYVDDYYGIDMTKGSGSGMDDNGHGTHVAGIIGASNNKAGIVGIAYNSKIMPIKAGDASGYFLQGNIARAIIYAYEHGADVINMSFGGTASSIAVQDALEVAYSRCVLVASAGNDGAPNEGMNAIPNYPAALSYVVGVMSTDQNDNESTFSNFDFKLYTAVEYEVYAPGERVLSTIPGGKYSTMSGTSMAAPVVAAQAALLRSYFSDTDKYPTKFIYGQIVGTADDVVSCNGHGSHNIPGRVNFKSSIEKFPTPDIGMSDYRVFDTAGYPEDTKKLTDGCESVNNGDGVIDAGETIALGMTLKNRWGMSKNTTVHIDAKSSSGIEHPYVTFLNNDIDYKSVGTYSEADSGKVYSEDGEKWTGWKDPFYIKIADDCPNDYTITLNVTMKYGNGLDESDTKEYSNKDKIKIVLKVRRGTILPNKITKDMTLTKDNYYIIPNSTVVMEGVILTIEEGTKIQFWCSDPEDAYADDAITYLKVCGKLISKGTEDEPVEMFPSDWMGKYRVEIYTADKGYASLKYTNVTNPYLTIDKADNCEFTQNYKDDIRYRFLRNGQIDWYYDGGKINCGNVTNSTFYKMGGARNSYSLYSLYGDSYSKCIFVDSYINYSEIGSIDKCVFYGNNNYWDNKDEGGTSSLVVKNKDDSFSVNKIFTNKETGHSYIDVTQNSVDKSCIDVYDRFAGKMGGGIVSFDNKDEFDYISGRLDTGYISGTKKDRDTDKYYNYNDTELPEDIPVIDENNTSYGYLKSGAIHFDNKFNNCKRYLLEIPGEINISDITLNDYVVSLDTEETYQIEASVTPATADAAKLVYESEDESIAKVDKTGKIAPVAAGSTNIRVYAPDRAVYNYVTVNVTETVIPESISAAKQDMTLAVGSSKRINVKFTPETSSKRTLTYESSKDSVASVDAWGLVTANGVGDAVITVTGYNGISTTVNVHCNIPAEKIGFKEEVYMTSMDKDDGKDFYPDITPADATDKDLEWESSDEKVCYVDGAGKLVKLKNGTATLRATLKGMKLTDELQVLISDNSSEISISKIVQTPDNRIYTLLEDGSLWIWGKTGKCIKGSISEPVKDFIVARSRNAVAVDVYILDDNGKVFQYDGNVTKKLKEDPLLDNIKALYSSSSKLSGSSNFALSNEGSVWAWGYNDCGQLGDGSKEHRDTVLVQVDLDATISDIVAEDSITAFMDDEGNVYVAGGTVKQYMKPTLLKNGAASIYSNGYSNITIDYKNSSYNLTRDGSIENNGNKSCESEKRYYGMIYYIEDGRVYVRGSINSTGRFGLGHTNDVSEFTSMLNMTNAEKVFPFKNNVYIQTIDGKLYATGKGTDYELANGKAENSSVPVRIYLGLADNHDSLAVESDNMTKGDDGTYSLDKTELVLDFNESLIRGSQYSTISLKDSSGSSVSVTKTLDLDKFSIKAKSGFKSGETYTLTIPANAVSSRYGMQNEALTYTFTYTGEQEESQVTDDTSKDNETADDEPSEEPAKEKHDTVVDEDKMAARDKITSESVTEEWNKFVEAGGDTRFYSNVILNRLSDDDTSGWLRITAPNSDEYKTIGLGGNYWGTTNKDLINKQILDFDDYQSLADINEGEILTEAPSDTYPFVVNAYLETNGEKTSTVGNETVKFNVEFNRDMDTSIPLKVMFGSSYPYAEYTVDGKYVTDRKWEGEIKLNTLIENGYQYWNVSNGKAKGTSMKLYKDWGRFPFLIDTSSAQSLLMQAEPTEEGINLTWSQDDFDTLAGYNVYRSTEEDGLYTKLNRTVIPADTKKWFDDTVEPGKKYYYNFTVVQSDMKESEPSGKVTVTSMDTMAPDIYHSPVYHAFTGSNLVISATVTDNVGIKEAKVYYRVKGQTEWNSKTMTNVNDKYSAAIDAKYITVEGLEYYIEATDGSKFTYKGTAEEPYEVTIQEAVSGSDMGDVDGNGAIEIKDAMMVLMAINDRLNLTEIQFARADLDGNGELSAKEALRIIQYVNGSVSSVLM